MTTVKVAFIGAGGIARQHMKGLVKMPGVEIVGLCDVNKARLKERRGEFGGEVFTDPAKMLTATRPDTAYICLPPFAHGPAEMACVRHKVPFMVEKPVAIDLKTARAIRAAVKRSGLMAGAAYMTRYRAGVQRARELLSEDPPALIYGGWIGGFPGNHPWLFDKKKSGGQLLEQTTHTVDLLRYLCGEVTTVSCYAAPRDFVKGAKNFRADCASTTAMKLKSGAVASIMSAWVTRAGGGIWLTLISPNYKIDITGWEASVKITHAGGRHVEEIKGEDDIFEIEDAAWIEAVRSGKPGGVLSDYDDGVKSLAVSLAANESMAAGKPVRVRA